MSRWHWVRPLDEGDWVSIDDLLQEARDGDLIACGGRWMLSRCIQCWTRCPVSHLAYLMWVQTGDAPERLCVMESVGGGVRLMPLSAIHQVYHRAGGKMWWAPLKDRTPAAATRNRALAAWGAGYPSKRQYFSVMSRLARWLWGHDVDAEAYTCSEFVAWCHMIDDPAQRTPRQVLESGLFGQPRLVVA